MGKATKGQSKKADRIQARVEDAGGFWIGWDGDFWRFNLNGENRHVRTLTNVTDVLFAGEEDDLGQTVPVGVKTKLSPRPPTPPANRPAHQRSVKTWIAEIERRANRRKNRNKGTKIGTARTILAGYGIDCPASVKDVEIFRNDRMKSNLGRFLRIPKTGEAWIDIHPKVLGSVEEQDTITHEIAHAMHPDDGHGSKWKAAAKALGGTGKRTCSTEQAEAIGMGRTRRPQRPVERFEMHPMG